MLVCRRVSLKSTQWKINHQMVESERTAMGIAMEPAQIAGIYESASRRKRIKDACVNHTQSASCFSSA